MKIDGIWFKNDDGHTLILRGANLSGSTKVPFSPDGATYHAEGFFDHRAVSFVGRPFPLAEADEHFSRLRAWGMTFLRFLITWEAIEHAGPGQYDFEYLDYVTAIVKKAGEHSISMFIDPHQDVWSRWTGGDGAPGWTLEMLGIDLTELQPTGSAISHQITGDPFPKMIWPSNYSRLGASLLFTLFFGGNDFAPATKIDGVPVQEYLQSHYINAIKQVAERLKELPNVVGYDSLNEPSTGLIGVPDLNTVPPGLLLLGPIPTSFQSMLLGAGYSREIATYEMGAEGLIPTGTSIANPDKHVLWKSGYDCVYRQNGIWTDEGGSPRLLRPDHFARKPDGSPVNPVADYLKPFMIRFINEIRTVDPRAFLFLEGRPGGEHPEWTPADPPNAVNAGHWYDIVTLITKHFGSEPADATRQASFTAALASQKHPVLPTLLGEFGLPFDLDEKAAYRTGDFSSHVRAIDMYYNAMDANLYSCTIWNYTADNTNARGDKWNDEDLSIFSRDQQAVDWHTDIHSGGRALSALVRPYATKIAGEPIQMHFDLPTRTFTFEFRHDSAVKPPTEIFLPTYQYPDGFWVTLSDGTYRYDPASQTLYVSHTHEIPTHTVKVTPKQNNQE